MCNANITTVSVITDTKKYKWTNVILRDTLNIKKSSVKSSKERRERDIAKAKHFVAPQARILIVDDTVVNLKMIRELLKKNEIKTDLAANGQDAIDMAKRKKYNMIFIDHIMPHMDGIKTMKEIQDGPNVDVPMVALTANTEVGSREFYLKAGFQDYLSKPVDGDKLEEMVEKYLLPEGVQQI